mgnify:CR=1 FL=1
MQKKLYHFLIIYDKIKKGKTKEKSSNNQGRKKEKMKNKVASFIITIVMLLIIIVLGLFILFVWQGKIVAFILLPLIKFSRKYVELLKILHHILNSSSLKMFL